MYHVIAKIGRRCALNLNYLFDPCTAFRRREPLTLPRQSGMARRALLAALPASGAALAFQALPSAAESPSPIMRSFGEWQRLRDATSGVPEDECDRLFDSMCAIASEMMEMPAQDGRDVLAKVVAWTSWGYLGLPEGSEHALFWTEVTTMLGQGPEVHMAAAD
ncbi:hypothetical protein [Pseudoruegeria sp. HB172150]|uniref:hypothetical protein n=1 Tax=Pseudoruegeria sp. HB172150 TaxID=2721164 RepID=UPI0015544DE1|nr:hypothetical protein [Pseudoruegeria sp. HB172150]